MTARIVPETTFAAVNQASIILSRTIADLPNTYDVTEGSFAYDLLAASSAEIESVYIELDDVANQSFVGTATGDYLDALADQFGLTRKPALNAQVTLTFTGTTGTDIPAATRVTNIVPPGTTGTPLAFETIADATVAGGTIDVLAQSVDVGNIYNVSASSLIQMAVALANISAVTNNAAATGGLDAETDDGLRARLVQRLQGGRGAGTQTDYQAWATSVNGVAFAYVEPLWNGNGTVRVTVVDVNYGPVTPAVLAAATTYLTSLAPIGSSLTVITPTTVPINVSASLTLSANYQESDITTQATTAFANYLQNIRPGGTVYINEMAAVLISIPGVIDYASFQIGDPSMGSSNLITPSGQKPIIGTVTFS